MGGFTGGNVGSGEKSILDPVGILGFGNEPDAPPPPPPPPPPPKPTKPNQAGAARLAQEERARKNRGIGASIITGGRGANAPATTGTQLLSGTR